MFDPLRPLVTLATADPRRQPPAGAAFTMYNLAATYDNAAFGRGNPVWQGVSDTAPGPALAVSTMPPLNPNRWKLSIYQHCYTAMQKTLFKNIEPNPCDKVYTPQDIVIDIMSFFPISGKCLDPCRGDGAFHKLLPDGSDWCEVRDGRDFFDYNFAVDWIVGNPPCSIFYDFLKHSFTLSSNIVYILPTNKVFQSFKIMDEIDNYGGIKTMLVYGSGQNVGFPWGFSVGAFHFKRDYGGATKIIFRRLRRVTTG